jgi:hypothetical protein
MGKFESLKPKLQNALALIDDFHIVRKDGAGSCIPSALTVRDFLRSLHFQAEVRPVVFFPDSDRARWTSP